MLVNIRQFWDFMSLSGPDSHGYDQVIVPVKTDTDQKHHLHYDLLRNGRQIEPDTMRTTGPLKYLFYTPRATVYPADYPDIKRIITGVKACDLQALALLDRALLQDGFTEPAYAHWRSRSLIIASDCTVPAPACHCTLTGGKPYAEFGYDVNVSVVGDDYYVLIGSDAGKAFLDRLANTFEVRQAPKSVQELVQANRHKMTHLIEQLNESFAHRANEWQFDSNAETWQEMAKACIGCGACTHICPTCYCLILNDESNNKVFTKVRSMDSCQYNGYARVAGGGTPRPKMSQRFRNRYLCKFSYMVDNFDMQGCTGCGRCVEACAAQIDFRKVVENVTTPEGV